MTDTDQAERLREAIAWARLSWQSEKHQYFMLPLADAAERALALEAENAKLRRLPEASRAEIGAFDRYLRDPTRLSLLSSKQQTIDELRAEVARLTQENAALAEQAETAETRLRARDKDEGDLTLAAAMVSRLTKENAALRAQLEERVP